MNHFKNEELRPNLYEQVMECAKYACKDDNEEIKVDLNHLIANCELDNFQALDKFCNDPDYSSQKIGWYKIISPNLYEFLIQALNTYQNRSIIIILTALTSGPSDILLELAKSNLLQVVKILVNSNSNSYLYLQLLQILSNYLGDEDANVNQIAKDTFSSKKLCEIIKVFSSVVQNTNGEVQYDCLLTKWIMCICGYLSTNHSIDDSKLFLSAMNQEKDYIMNNTDCSIYFCLAIKKMAISQSLDLSFFNELCIPTFLITLSNYEEEETSRIAIDCINTLYSGNNFNLINDAATLVFLDKLNPNINDQSFIAVSNLICSLLRKNFESLRIFIENNWYDKLCQMYEEVSATKKGSIFEMIFNCLISVEQENFVTITEQDQRIVTMILDQLNSSTHCVVSLELIRDYLQIMNDNFPDEWESKQLAQEIMKNYEIFVELVNSENSEVSQNSSIICQIIELLSNED